MTLRDKLLPTVDKVRKLPGKLGFRLFAVTLVRQTGGDWSKGIAPTLTTLENITVFEGYNPKVRWMNQGDYARGTPADVVLEVGPITPAYDGGGYTYEDLEDLSAPKNSTILYRITGPGMLTNGSLFAKTSFSGNRALGFFIQLRRVNTAADNG